jgi:hypothetical protein
VILGPTGTLPPSRASGFLIPEAHAPRSPEDQTLSTTMVRGKKVGLGEFLGDQAAAYIPGAALPSGPRIRYV